MTVTRLWAFSDRIFQITDLRRTAVEVIEAAEKGPVTIVRAGRKTSLALMTRDIAQDLAAIATAQREAAPVLAVAAGTLDPKIRQAASWVLQLDDDDRRRMALEVSEMLCAVTDWTDAQDLIETLNDWRTIALGGTIVIDESGAVVSREPAES